MFVTRVFGGFLFLQESEPENVGIRRICMRQTECLSASQRVYRGGSWRNLAVYARSANRVRNNPGFRNYNLGARPSRSQNNQLSSLSTNQRSQPTMTETKQQFSAESQAVFGPPAEAGEVRINPKDGSEMIFVPDGAPIVGEGQERRRIFVEGFWIAKNPVTVAQYRRYCEDVGIDFPEQPEWSTDNHPVVNVSNDDSVKYCVWAELRLPDDNEWEYAARGTDGRTYPWGNEDPTPELCVYEREDGAEPVGGRPKGVSPFGCHDMSGNVWEHTSSCYHEDRWHHPMPNALELLANVDLGEDDVRAKLAEANIDPNDEEAVTQFVSNLQLGASD
jgi:formylglycine-generating enzyme required for sulfatase activity